MYKHNILTSQDKRKFSHMRNGCLGQLHMAKTAFANMLNSDLISPSDRFCINSAIKEINRVLNRWDKHYSKKVFEQLKKAKEENKENI